ncbi:MAG TPA: hypothetical protein VLF62_04215 [Candidatus Saccharimonadales bacterium]|nr:hypothetical protein [Candidatus Saccharimonadales bacterium]
MGKNELSSEDIGLGMRMQRLDDFPVAGSAYRAARWLWAGSGSESHVWVRWQPVSKVIHTAGINLVQTRANKEAGLSPRNYRRAAVFAAGAAAVARVLAEHGPHGLPAMVYEHDGHTYAGPFERPQGFGLLQGPETGIGPEDLLLAGAARQGAQPMVGGMGVLYPERSQVVLPQGMHLVRDLVPTRSMAATYPGVPMV